MMSMSKDSLIREVQDSGRERSDLSLRGKAWSRAVTQRPPRTMTAWEWEEWYARHGVPESHRKPNTDGWWQRIAGKLMPMLVPARGK